MNEFSRTDSLWLLQFWCVKMLGCLLLTCFPFPVPLSMGSLWVLINIKNKHRLAGLLDRHFERDLTPPGRHFSLPSQSLSIDTCVASIASLGLIQLPKVRILFQEAIFSSWQRKKPASLFLHAGFAVSVLKAMVTWRRFGAQSKPWTGLTQVPGASPGVLLVCSLWRHSRRAGQCMDVRWLPRAALRTWQHPGKAVQAWSMHGFERVGKRRREGRERWGKMEQGEGSRGGNRIALGK